MDLRSARRSTAIIATLALAVVVGFLLDALGLAPWLLCAGAALSVILALGQRIAWLPAVAASVVGLLALYAFAVRILQPIPADLGTKNRVLVLVIAGVALAISWRHRRALRLPSSSARPLLIALAPIVALAVGAVIAVSVSGGTRVAWSMQNDAIWNTMMARFLYGDLGAGPAHPNVSPLIPALLAGAFAPGRSALGAAELLQHDVSRQAELWLFLVLISSLLAGLLAWRELARYRPFGRAAGSFLVACIPLSWYAAGYAFQFGFFNATVSLFALLCAWIGWVTARESRLVSIVILSASTIVMLATWAPLGIVTISLGLGVLLGSRREWWRTLRGLRLAVFIASLAVIPLYLVAITLPDLLREGKGLSANGGIIAIEPRHILVVGAVALGATAWLAFRRATDRDRAPLIGVAIVGAASAVALVYLALQRTGQESWWGYYPQKLSWLVATLLVIVIAVAVMRAAPGRSLPRRAALAGAAVLVVALMSFPLPTRTSVAILASAFLPVPAVVSTDTTAALFAASDVSRLTVFAGYGTPGEDAFANGWLIQQFAESGEDPVREFAYSVDGTDLGRLCSLAQAPRVDLVVRTHDSALAGAFDAACPGVDVTVRVG